MNEGQMGGVSSIRPATSADLEAVMAIESSWQTTPHWTRTHFENELSSERAYFCVCAPLGDVEGYAGLCLLPPEAQVTTVAVRPDRARKGLGRRLMEHLHAVALRAGCSIMTLEVSAVNQAALSLYENLGYRIVGRRAKYYNDGSDALLMSRRPT